MSVLVFGSTIFLLIGLLYWLFMSSYSQIFGTYPYKVITKDKIVALTFDDGPNDPYTSQILSYLSEKNIKATFFLVGKCTERYPDTARKIITDGHTVGNHSVSHEFHKYFQSLYFYDEIIQNQEIIKKATGKLPGLYRSPWLLRQPWLLKTVKTNGMYPVSGVFCHVLEVTKPGAERIAKRAINKVRPGSILIFHDGIEGRGGDRQQTVEAVKLTVEALLLKGYQFTTVDKLLQVPAYL
jgi:peptidoglycan/xylan/chitin deacetylase (PgdA/CDA1 family)